MADAPRVAEEYELAVMLPPSYILLSGACSGIGQIENSLALSDRGLALAENRATLYYLVDWLVISTEVYLRGGNSARAQELADRALRLAQDLEQPGNEARALHARAQVAAARGNTKDAEADWYAAIRRAGHLEMRSLLPNCHLGLGRLYETSGERDRARLHLTTAVSLFREMGMAHWLEQAESDLARLS